MTGAFPIGPIPDGTITTPKGFMAGATFAGIKKEGLDVGILYSSVPCTAAGVFTSNKIVAAPVILSRNHLSNAVAQAVVVNSGCANACTGEQGLLDARTTAALTAQKKGILTEDVLVASTGLIGARLPMDKIRRAIVQVELSSDGGHLLAQAIMTTDTHPKEVAIGFDAQGVSAIIGGVAKGAGMIHPHLATLIGLLTTDAAVSAPFLQEALRQAVDASFNMVSIDGDTSTNDTVILLANGLSNNKTIDRNSPAAEAFQDALNQACTHLAKEIARDGEGATKLIEVKLEGAASVNEARQAARCIVSSNLVKAAIHGADPNWGRILAALGRSGSQIIESKIALFLNDIEVMHEGAPLPFDQEAMKIALAKPQVNIVVHLNLGDCATTAWGCDLTEEYVTFNSAYVT